MFRTNSDYIHEFDDLIEYEEILESADVDVATAIVDYVKTERKVKYSAMFENADNEYLLEAAKKNIFERIGDGIKSLINKLVTMIKKLFGRDDDKKFKDNLAAAQKSLQDNPSLNEKLIQGLKNGEISIKNISDYTKAYEEASKLLAEGKIDPKTFKGKMEIALKHFDEEPKMVKRIKNVATAVGIGGTVYTAIKKNTETTNALRNAVNRAYNRFHNIRGSKDESGEYNTVLTAFWEGTKSFMNANAEETHNSNKILSFLNKLYRSVGDKTGKSLSDDAAANHREKAHRGDNDWPEVKNIREQIEIETKRLNDPQTSSNDKVKAENRIKALKSRLNEIDKSISPVDRILNNADAGSDRLNTAHAKREAELDAREKKIEQQAKSVQAEITRVKNMANKARSALSKSGGYTLNEINSQYDEIVNIQKSLKSLRDKLNKEATSANSSGDQNSYNAALNEINRTNSIISELETKRQDIYKKLKYMKDHHLTSMRKSR